MFPSEDILAICGSSNFELLGIAPSADTLDGVNWLWDKFLFIGIFCPFYWSVYGHNNPMDQAEYVAKFCCSICGKRYVVMILARDCEEKHMDGE